MFAMAGVIVLLLIAVGYFATRGGGGAQDSRDGEVAVTTRNPGAAVKIDGKPAGVTPVTVSLPPGPHVVEVQMGDGEPRVVPVMIRSGVQTAQYVELPESLQPQKVPPEKTKKR
jgi:PEGA domain-containing protein